MYRGIDGFDIPDSDSARVRQSKGSPTYGELTPTGVLRLLEHLSLGPKDVFYDLGSGSGKVVIGAAIATRARKCVGIELSKERFTHAQKVLKRVRQQKLLTARACGFRRQNLLETYLADATVVYTCSTAFSFRFMDSIGRRLMELNRELRLVTLQEFSRPPRTAVLEGEVVLPTTWDRRCSASIYQFERSR